MEASRITVTPCSFQRLADFGWIVTTWDHPLQVLSHWYFRSLLEPGMVAAVLLLLPKFQWTFNRIDNT